MGHDYHQEKRSVREQWASIGLTAQTLLRGTNYTKYALPPLRTESVLDQ